MIAPALPAPLDALAADPAHGALFLDFDGTLSAIVDDPVGARRSPVCPRSSASWPLPSLWWP